MKIWIKNLLLTSAISIALLTGCATTNNHKLCTDSSSPENQELCDNETKKQKKNDEDDMERMD